MPRDMPRLLAILVSLALLAGSGCTTITPTASAWQWPSLAGTPEPPGTPGWWKKHKGDAEFVPTKGYRVAGVEGYFDEEGRSIKTQVAKVVKKEKDSGLLHDANVVKTVADVKSQFGLGPDQRLAEEAFAAGEDLFRREDYGKAAKKFKEAISRWPDSGLEQNAMFYVAESQFFADKYSQAIDSYSALLEKYPNSPHLDKTIRRQFDIARYWEEHHRWQPHYVTTPNFFDKTRPLFDTLGNSMKAYEDIRLNDPTGPLADDSIMATANSYFLRGRYNDADYYYGLLRREYPRSEHQYEAHVLGLQCLLRKYQGPDYDASPLLQAKKLVKQLKTQFGAELDIAERERLAEIQGNLIKQLAARDYKRAKGYDDTGHYESARFYYSQIVREYPNTPLAVDSRKRYEELAGKPAHPESSMEWLLNLFPENAERTAIAQVPMVDNSNQTQIARQPENTSTGTIVR